MGRAFEVRKAAMMKTGLAKAKVYTRHSKEIYICAKSGGGDPESNLNLKRLIEKAKKDQVPADVIKRAIDKVNSGASEDFKANMYEGFGPSGSTILVECLTDNANRTISDVKNCFTKTNNKIGVSGSVAHMYEHVGIVDVKDISVDEMMDFLIENDAEFIDIEEDEEITTILTTVDNFMETRNIIDSKYSDSIESDEIVWKASTTISLEGEDKESFQKLVDMLNDTDDVQNIYHNVENV